MRTATTILSTVVTADTTDASLLSLWSDAVTRAECGAASREWVVYSAATTGGRKQADLAHLPVGKDGKEVGKSQVNNYVQHWTMWLDLGLSSDESVITRAWSATTGSRGWFSKRSTDEYADLRSKVQATDDQDEKVRLILAADLPSKVKDETPAGGEGEGEGTAAPVVAETDLIALLQRADESAAPMSDADQAIVRALVESILAKVAPVAVAA